MADGFKINKAYAENYNSWRQREELQKLKNKYGDEEDSEDSSSSESEDDDAEALTEQLEKDWLRTLSALKSKDPKIYQKDFKFYHDEEDAEIKSSKKVKDKPMYIKDYERKVILEKGGLISDDEVPDDEEPSTSFRSQLGYHQEQEQLRKSFVAAAAGSDSSDSDDDNDGLLTRREKTRDEKQGADTDYVEWLKGQKDNLDTEKAVGVELEPLKNYWQNKHLDAGEKFLKNYILNRQFIDKDDDNMPTYDDIVDDDDEDFSDDEELLTNQDLFERKYNFRFEEPDAAEIRTFPRNVEETVRRKDTKRSDQRKDVEERKKREKEKKIEELKQLKKLKRQEIMDKIEKLKQITGNKNLAFDERELEEDFDPSKHDQMMEKCFDDGYYGECAGEDVKPVFDMSDEETENWDKWTGEGHGSEHYEGGEVYGDQPWNEEPNAEDPDFVMDADYDPDADRARKKNKKEKKRKNKLAQALATKKPVFDPDEKTFEEYFDEYYKLDYEDIIDDMPCRFKYRKVTPNSYGLSTDEILKCRDKELNAWASIKKMSQYRTEDEETYDIRAYTSKGKNLKKKQNVLTSLFESEEKDDAMERTVDKPDNSGESKSKKKRKKRKAKKKVEGGGEGSEETKQKAEDCGSDSGIASQSANTELTCSEKRNKNRKMHEEISRDVSNNSDKTETVGKQVEPQHDGNIKQTKKRKVEEAFEENGFNSDVTKEGKSRKKKHEAEKKTITDLNSDSQTESSGDKVDSSEINADMSNFNKSGEIKQTNEKRKKKKNKKKKNKDGQKLQISEERLKAYGINPKKYKYMKKEELFQIKARKNTKQVS